MKIINNMVMLYTDGSYCAKRSLGGYGCYFESNNSDIDNRKMSGCVEHTTSNRMELFAVIKGLQSLQYTCSVTVITDSRYVSTAFTHEKLANWLLNDWKMANGKEPCNLDLWKQLYEVMKKHDVTFKWVRGHNWVSGNEIADCLASDAVKKYEGKKGKKTDRFRKKGK